MKVIGFSSGIVGRLGNVDRMVKAIMDESGYESEFVKLTDLSYSGCKGFAQLCAKPQICLLEDDLFPYYQKIKEADAVVVGSPVYSGSINAAATGFLERFFGYGHVTRTLKDKPFIGVVCGQRRTDEAVIQLRRRLRRTTLLGIVEYHSQMPPCLICGRHQECSVGGLYRIMGEAAHSLVITPDLFRRWEDEPKTVKAVTEAATKLKRLLS